MLAVAAAIIKRNGKYLIARRNPDDAMGGYWEFPGGGVDEGETPDQCVVREVREELGVSCTPLSLFDAGISGNGKAVLLFYLCDIEGDPQPLDCAELQWVEPDRLIDFELIPADLDVARRLMK